MFGFARRPATHCVGLSIARTINGCNSNGRVCMFGIPKARDCLRKSVGTSNGVSNGSLASCAGCAKLEGNSSSFRKCVDGNSVGGGNLVSTCSVSIITARLRNNISGHNARGISNAVRVDASGRMCSGSRVVRVRMGNISLHTIGTFDFTLPCGRRSCRFINIRLRRVGTVRGLACSHLRSGNSGTLCPAFIGMKGGGALRKAISLFLLGFGTGHRIGFNLGVVSNLLMSGELGAHESNIRWLN